MQTCQTYEKQCKTYVRCFPNFNSIKNSRKKKLRKEEKIRERGRKRERARERYEKSQTEVATHLKEEKFC
jgi:hypothetical protein